MKSPHTARVEELFSQMTSKPLHEPTPSTQGEPHAVPVQPQSVDPLPDLSTINSSKIPSRTQSSGSLPAPALFTNLESTFGISISSSPNSVVHTLHTTISSLPSELAPKAQPVTHVMYCSLEELYNGTEKRIKIIRYFFTLFFNF